MSEAVTKFKEGNAMNEITIPRRALSEAYDSAARATPTRTPKEILKNVLLRCVNGTATLTGTDEEVAVQQSFPCDQDASMSCLFPGRVAEILKVSTAETVTLSIVKDSRFVTEWALVISAGMSEFRLALHDLSMFPEVPTVSGDRVELGARWFRESIQRTQFCTDSSVRYSLGGILLDISPDAVAIVATDGKRLAAQVTRGWTKCTRSIIPLKAAVFMESLAKGMESVSIVISSNAVALETPSGVCYARLVEGRFPDYQAIMKDEVVTTVEVQSGPFLSLVRQALLVQNKETSEATFEFSNNTLIVSAVCADVGKFESSTPVKIDGPSQTVSLNPMLVEQYLRSQIDIGTITIRMSDPESKVTFSSGEGDTYIQMPLS